MQRWLFLGLVVLTQISCSSYFTRKSCEKVNWFQHAYNVAMDGKRLEEDGRYKECEKVETEMNSAEIDRGFKAGMENYCKPQTAHDKGAAGVAAINYDFCDSNLAPRLRARHQEGLKKFCQPDSAYTFASTGGVYKNQCPKDMEASYMAKYRKGRQIYLKNQIASHEGTITGLESEIREQQSLRNQVSNRIARLPRTSIVNKTKTYDAATKSYKESTAVTEDPKVQREREDLESQLRNHNSAIQNRQSKQSQLREEIHSFRAEMESLN